MKTEEPVHDTVVIYSGGMDSYTLVNETYGEGRLAAALSFDYGQRHRKELNCASKVCEDLGVPHQVIHLFNIKRLLPGSALTDDEVQVPEGHYAEESMKQTVVPSRNLIMLAIASGYAVGHDLKRVLYAAHAGDHTIYPDCRPEFVQAVNAVTQLANWKPVSVEAPYLDFTKRDILERGFNMSLDYADTWTCYKGLDLSCGVCGSCQERLEAFKQVGRRDPLEYFQDDPNRVEGD